MSQLHKPSKTQAYLPCPMYKFMFTSAFNIVVSLDFPKMEE